MINDEFRQKSLLSFINLGNQTSYIPKFPELCPNIPSSHLFSVSVKENKIFNRFFELLNCFIWSCKFIQNKESSFWKNNPFLQKNSNSNSNLNSSWNMKTKISQICGSRKLINLQIHVLQNILRSCNPVFVL